MIKNISAIGLKSIEKNKKAISHVVKNVAYNPDRAFSYKRKDGKSSIEHYGYAGDSFGIVVYGVKNDKDEIRTSRWNSFILSEKNINISNVSFEKMPNGDVFAFCEDELTGTELEFRVNNLIDYSVFKEKSALRWMEEAVANIAALGKAGNIIFPVEKSEDSLKLRAEENDKIRELVKRLRSGDEAAEKKLLDHSLEIASAVRERLKTEDVLSVFEGYCLPYGEMEGSYALLGDITSVDSVINNITDESIYNLGIDVTGVKFNMLINKSDVIGIPMIGMRFMGICDLQGSVEFV